MGEIKLIILEFKYFVVVSVCILLILVICILLELKDIFIDNGI